MFCPSCFASQNPVFGYGIADSHQKNNRHTRVCAHVCMCNMITTGSIATPRCLLTFALLTTSDVFFKSKITNKKSKDYLFEMMCLILS